MHKKLYWGLGALIILFGTAFVFMMLRTGAENRQLEQELADLVESEQSKTEQPVADNKPQRQARPGYKWVQHDDHWDEVPQTPKPYTPEETELSYGERLKIFLKKEKEFSEKIVTERLENLKKTARKSGKYNIEKKVYKLDLKMADVSREIREMSNAIQAGDVMSAEEWKHYYALGRQSNQIVQEADQLWEGYEAEVDKEYNRLLEHENWEGYEAEVEKDYNRRIEGHITEEEYNRRMEGQSNGK